MLNDYLTIDRLIKEAGNQPIILLETLKPDHPNCRTLLFLDPVTIVRADSPSEVVAAFEEVERHLNAGRYAAGYVSYEAGYVFESSLLSLAQSIEYGNPLVWFGIFTKPAFDLTYGTRDTAVYSDIPFDNEKSATGSPGEWLEIDDYHFSIDRIKSYIASGDTYQINYTGQFKFSSPVSAYACYRRLTQCQPVSYSAYIHHDDISVISLSPELFFRTEKGRIWSKPMKGTSQRGRTTGEDNIFIEKLRTSDKDRAENVMIVDLIRNDFGKVCKPGTISVPELYSVEKYNTLLQMTSTVTGDLREDVGLGDLFKALFPCGSVTGAPKLRSMEIIHELESEPRGIYTGAIGYAGPEGRSSFSVAIRTAVISGKCGSMGIGSGIVWDSDPKAEYDECMLKRKFFEVAPANNFALIETMKCVNGQIRLLDNHLDRLTDSAEFFGYPASRSEIRKQIIILTEQLDPSIAYKIRLLLHCNGEMTIGKEDISESAETAIPKIAFASEHTDSSDLYLFHKTTNRTLYKKWFDIALKHNLADIIFTNERGEITEGCISNIFVKLHGEIITPPQNCGLLDGVMRQYFIHRISNVNERILTPDDLKEAEHIWLTNAVRGIREVTLTQSGIETGNY